MPISATDLNKAYLAYFGRPADATGRAYFATLEQADVIKAFDASAESKAIYGEDTASKINAIYKNLFNREAEPAGLSYWLGQISSGKVTPAGAAFAILSGALGTDKTAVENKLAASAAFILSLDTTAEIVGYSGLNAAASARAFLATVSDSAASLTAAVAGAQAAVTAAINAGTNEAGASTVLKTTQDILVGTAGNDVFRAVAGKTDGTQDQTTLNSSDIIDGAAGNDTLIVNLTGTLYQGGARLKNIETLQLGTNVLNIPGGFGSRFDYNVNQGTNEITEVTTIVADQINAGEMLTVQNIVRTDAAGAKVLPTLSWVNDSNTGVAGTVNYDYRAAELTGTADTQVVSLDSVNNGVLNLAAGIETVTLKSVAGERVTLLNSDRRDNATAGVNDVAADIISNGSLTTVNIEAAGEVGKVGGRVVTTGLVDRVATDGLGDASIGTAANLLSVGARVTTVNAKDSTAAVNVQFLAKVTGAATDVTFTGGKGGDYAEFEVGNVNADGGEGSDVFAFVTQRAGVTNSTFGSGDSIKGGAGTDTIQIGVNGVGNYDVASSEFLNKSGIDVLDLRGAVNTVSVSAAFAGQTDSAALQITTDNVVVGGTAPSNAEAATVNTINLRELTPGQAIKFTGGQGSDRLILKDGVYTQAMDLDGGLQTDAAGVAAAGDYDTLTVVNSAVLDRTDLSKTRNFEGLNLVKDVVGASQFTVELTEAFLLANTAAVNSLTTSIDDRVFQIGSVVSPFAGANALAGGDIVKIDVTDLFNTATNTIKASVAGRQIDTNGLGAATVQYVYNGNTLTLAQLQAAVTGAAVVTGNDAARADVIGAGAPGAVVVPTATVALTAGGTFTGTAGTNDTFTGTIASLVGTTVTGTVADTESLTVTDAGAVAVPGTVTNIDVINLANGTNSLTGAVATGATTINGGTGVDTLVLAPTNNISGITLNSIESIQLGGAATMRIAQHNGVILTGATGAANLTLTDAGTINAAAPAVAQQYVLAAGANTFNASATAGTVSVTAAAGTTSATFNFGATLDALDAITGNGTGTTDTLNVSGNATSTTDANLVGVEIINITGNAAAVTLTLTGQTEAFTINASGRGDTIVAGNAGDTIVGGAGADVITGGLGADRITTGAGSDIVVMSTGVTVDTITDFTAGAGGDVIRISEAVTAVAGVNTLAFISGTAAQVAAAGAGLGADGNNINVALLTDVGYASQAAAWNAINTATAIGESEGTYLVFFNSSTNRAEVWYDTNLTNQAGAVQVATLDNVVTLAGVQTLIGTNFSVVA